MTIEKKLKRKRYGHVTRSTGLDKKQSSKEQWKEREGEKDKKGGGRITSPNGQKRL